MKKRTYLNAIILAFMMSLSTRSSADTEVNSKPLSPRIANYDITCTLKPDKKTIEGYERVSWRNTSSDIMADLQFHLYMNAFKNSESTFLKESGLNRWGSRDELEDWGSIAVDSMRIVGGGDLGAAMQSYQPDDGNGDDQTVLRVPLPKGIKPGKTIELDIWFNVKLPKIYARTGYEDDDFFFIGQWFPKLGVYTANGWNCHQFHRNSEFFADFGVYNVSITLPQEYVVGATGELQEEIPLGDSSKTVIYRAEDVHDFAWTASPHYLLAEDQFEHVKLFLLYQPVHQHQVSRHFYPAKQTLKHFKEWFGEYPYRTLTIVDPPLSAKRASGMEYPTLITAGAISFLPEGIRFTELVTEHEFGHNYWYGMVASNEFEEAWLDEGINSFCEAKMMETMFGKQGNIVDFGGIKISDDEFQHISYFNTPDRDPIVKPSWEFYPGTYSKYVYSKAALMLGTLENYLGQETMSRVMRTYFQRWKFKHPRTRDFIDIVNEVAAQNMDWFFDQTLFGSDVLDYEVARIRIYEISEPVGIGFDPVDANPDTARDVPAESLKVDSEADTLVAAVDSLDKNDEAPAQFCSKILVRRNGGVTFPVEVLITFENGDEIREHWDGKSRWHEFEYTGTDKVASAQIDPLNKILLDVNWTNNSRTAEPVSAGPNRWAIKWLFWIQNLLQLVSSMS
ncbi:M1 family metallopeptidase [candidate division KSB1 bacterium]|nr:M1 family metallopeptidase [candidate division KSB1 bacterium]